MVHISVIAVKYETLTLLTRFIQIMFKIHRKIIFATKWVINIRKFWFIFLEMQIFHNIFIVVKYITVLILKQQTLCAFDW